MKIPYGISNYRTIKEEGYCYVDKTMYLEKLEIEISINLRLSSGLS